MTHVEVHWVDLESYERTKCVLPHSLELQFESDRVWIAAVEVAHGRDGGDFGLHAYTELQSVIWPG